MRFEMALKKLPKFMRDHDAGREALEAFWKASALWALEEAAKVCEAERARYKLDEASRAELFMLLSKSQTANPEWRVEVDLALLRALGDIVFGPNV